MGAKKGRRGAAKLSRHKKAYWRRGADVGDAIERSRIADATGIASKSDEQLFSVDRSRAAGGRVAKPRRPATKTGFRNLEAMAAERGPAPGVASGGGGARPVNKSVRKLRQRTGVQQRQLAQDCARMAAKAAKSRGRPAAAAVGDAERTANRWDVLRDDHYERRQAAGFDLWLDGGEPSAEAAAPVAEHHLRSTKRLRVKKPAGGLRPPATLVPSVETPHPGQSWNPECGEHEALLRTAAEAERRKAAKEDTLERRITAARGAVLANDASKWRELAEGIFGAEPAVGEPKKEEEEDAADGSQSDPDDGAECAVKSGTVTGPRIKTRQERKKQKSVAETEKLRKVQKAEKAHSKDIYSLKRLKREIAATDRLHAERQQRRRGAKAARLMTGRVLLGKRRAAAAAATQGDADLALTDELVPSLRQLKPEGDVLTERWHSLQKRRIVEATLRAKTKRKYKLGKRYDKRSRQQQ